jgi:hypothetical protein
MTVELTWNVVHFSGLLNRWFTTLKMRDEPFAVNSQGHNFVQVYNQSVPKRIKQRNNSLIHHPSCSSQAARNGAQA